MVPLDELARELEQELASSPQTSDLANQVMMIERAVQDVWKSNAMIWFTDHGPSHSRRVAEYALNLAKPPSIAAELRLTPLESFVLFASSWLHDIGMQDLSGAGTIGGNLNPSTVRHEHPMRTYTRIEADWSSWGLPKDDAPLAELVAWVARAHGTKYYKPTVAILEDLKTVRNQPVRGRLLACLLLMADELDLHYERAMSFSGFGMLNNVSEAHFLKHRCVEGVRSEYSTNGDLCIDIDLVYSSGLPEECRELVRKWIDVKLRQQMGMTEKELLEGFSSQVRYNRSIRFNQRTRTGFSWPLPGNAAIQVIEADVARDHLINHATSVATAEAALRPRCALAVVGNRTSSHTAGSNAPSLEEEDGQQDFLEAFCCAAALDGWHILWSRRANLGLGATAADVLEEWCQASNSTEGGGNTEEHRRVHFLRALLQRIAAGENDRYLLTCSESLPVRTTATFSRFTVPT
jgi:hypothetical protein